MPPVRETRHLWVGNIPDGTTEEKLIEFFQRYGRIDSVKILAKRSLDGGQAAFVDFVDIRCAIKAHETPNRLGDRELRTDYNEPASSTLTRSQGETGRRYDRGGRGPGDEGYSSRQTEAFQGNYTYKDDGPTRSRDYERADGGERNTTRATEENPGPYHRQTHQPGKDKDSDSGQSGSGTALSGSGSDSSDSGDSDSDSDSDSSASENSRGGKKTTALQIRNLSSRPTDATIREGLYHEFKKHGEVGQIKVFGRESNRYAVVYFRRHEHVMKAMETCRGKMFLGVEMELTPHTDDHYEGSFHRYRRHNEGGSSSFGTADDVYLFNATRTIFVGNFERNTNANELKRMFERYGEIVDIDIKKQGSNGAYAFIQYLDITHAVEAKKQMNRVLSGRNRLKIGFGKGMPTSTIWLGGLPVNITEQMLERQFQRYGRINRVGLDQQRSYAMVTFDNIDGSTIAHNEAKDRPVFGKRIRVDYASRESQHFFYDYLARTGQGDGRRYEPSPPPPSYRPRAKYDDIRSRTGPKQDNRGSKYHGYDHGYERGPAFNEGGRGRGHYDDYYRGSAGGGGGYESDDFGQELREYNVTRERERERERAREREQDRRQEPPPRRRHHREPARHEANTESDGERYYSRGEHSDVWPGDSGKDRASRESSVEPRDESHRRGDKRRDGDKRKTEDKRGHVKVKYDEQSEEDMEPSVKQPADKKERRDKVYRKKPTEPREEAAKPEFYPTNYEKGYGNGDGKEKIVTVKRKVKVKEHPEGTPAVEGKIRPEEVTVKVENVREEKVRRIDKEERITEKMTKKIKHKDGKKKRKHKKSPEIIPPVETPTASNLSRHVDSDGTTEGVGYESRGNRLESRVEKRSVTTTEEGREERKVIKSMIVQKPVPENAERDRRDYGEERRPRSPSPEDAEVHVPRKRPRSPEYDAEHSRVKNAKHAESGRHSNGNHYDDVKPKKERTSREATPPPPPPPPPPYNHSAKPKPIQNDPRQLAKVSSAARESPVAAPAKTGGYLAPTRPSRDMTFKPQVTELVPVPSLGGTAKHVTSGQTSGHPSPTNSPAPAQTGSSTVPNSDDTLMELLRRHPVMWQGLLGLKNDSAAIQMHYVSGNSKLAEYSLPKPGEGTGPNGLAIPPVLRIAQRMRMEASQLDGVTKRMQLDKEHCLLLALPCGRDPLDVHAQTRALKNGFIAYLQQKLAAGIINIAQPGSQQASFVLHVFPPCEFTHSHLSRVAPNLLDSATDSGHLMVVVATV